MSHPENVVRVILMVCMIASFVVIVRHPKFKDVMEKLFDDFRKR